MGYRAFDDECIIKNRNNDKGGQHDNVKKETELKYHETFRKKVLCIDCIKKIDSIINFKISYQILAG